MLSIAVLIYGIKLTSQERKIYTRDAIVAELTVEEILESTQTTNVAWSGVKVYRGKSNPIRVYNKCTPYILPKTSNPVLALLMYVNEHRDCQYEHRGYSLAQ